VVVEKDLNLDYREELEENRPDINY
jgi:hypothetical protein